MTQIKTYDISNQRGDTLSIINFGARLISWHTRVNNEIRNIVFISKFLISYKFNNTCSGSFPPKIIELGFSNISFTVFRNPTDSLPSIIR